MSFKDLFRNCWALVLAAVLLYVFWPEIFSRGWLVTGGFIVTCGLSFYKGKIFENPAVVGYIILP